MQSFQNKETDVDKMQDILLRAHEQLELKPGRKSEVSIEDKSIKEHWKTPPFTLKYDNSSALFSIVQTAPFQYFPE
jgi:hypothetical protein